MHLFPSEEWVEAWVELANESAEFERSGEGWHGAVAAVIEADADAGIPVPLYVRLEGRHGKWLGHAYGTDSALMDEAVFVLRAPYQRWKELIRQELHPIKGVLLGKIRIQGHLPLILRWTKSIAILAELAGRLETAFVDEHRLDSGSRESDVGT